MGMMASKKQTVGDPTEVEREEWEDGKVILLLWGNGKL